MARRKAAPKREIIPDPLFRSELLAKFINAVMRNGKKSVAEKIVYGALGVVARLVQGKFSDGNGESGEGKKHFFGNIRMDGGARAVALETFRTALSNVMPSVEVKSRRVGGSTYQVPVEIRAVRRQTLAMRWLSEYANQRNEKTMTLRLASEILDAVENRGGAVKKREEVHRMAKANQAFAHYRW
ncbi:30S ribosomal protein S7 [Coxiella endosymbiont of Amblyomma nuttalli]|uniref:30S ribosomal protein S7 n=1 Tax=Coxiella endosymbiont of Amblyomma nuttalli TaxID=2749996 RepID=UPI001BAA50F6|nr:30S ribosomal protein S7 [Coxiella endosymbiont of Amblyomma nuttalli]QTS83787.1 30S ribosomal protein S7 [Coxiella endosymbiont of Amblyomma nuttalli]